MTEDSSRFLFKFLNVKNTIVCNIHKQRARQSEIGEMFSFVKWASVQDSTLNLSYIVISNLSILFFRVLKQGGGVDGTSSLTNILIFKL